MQNEAGASQHQHQQIFALLPQNKEGNEVELSFS